MKQYTCKSCKVVKKINYRTSRHKHICCGCRNREKNNKPVEFKNLVTGRVVKAPSITRFVKYRRLGASARFHFSEVLNGVRLHYKGWALNRDYNLDKSKIQIVEQVLIKQAMS